MKAFKPWLALPPKLAHDLAPIGLELYSALFGSSHSTTWMPFDFSGLHFSNRLGIAGGVDKNAELCSAFQRLGAGFVEVGTITPLPQTSNPGKIIDRDLESMALWNKMGFPSHGMDEAYYNLKKFIDSEIKPENKTSPSRVPVFVNVGKNRSTSNEDAHKDYVKCIERLSPVADAFVINISSPNTSGLRDLLKPENLERFLAPIMAGRTKKNGTAKPFFLKVSPDLSSSELNQATQIALDQGFDGFIVTNTTLSREGLGPEAKARFSAEGGVSGRPLRQLSLNALETVLKSVAKQNQKKLVVSAGGVMTPEDVFERIKSGADLVQIYSALVFEGPGFFKQVAKRA